MKKLTKRNKDGSIDFCGKYGDPPYPVVTQETIEKLADYEDLGFTTEEIAYMAKFFKEQTSAEVIADNMKTIERLLEWSKWKEAEEEGRLVVLPCKVGDTVYFQNKYYGKSIIEAEIKCMRFRTTENKVLFGADVEFNIVDPYYADGRLMRCGAIVGIENNFGNQPTAFLTREEAEAELEKMKGEAK